MSEFVSGLIAFVFFIMSIGVIVLFFKVVNHINRVTARNVEDRKKHEQHVDYQRQVTAEQKSARYILSHNPTRYQMEAILRNPKTPADRNLAIKTALASNDIRLIGLLTTYAPECGTETMLAYYAAQFDQDDGQNAMATLEEFRDWELLDGPEGNWWRLWKPKLEAKVRAYKLRKAEADGYKVCHKCDTIDPPRCHCGECISGDGECSNHNGECYHCAYPDNDDDGDDYWDYCDK